MKRHGSWASSRWRSLAWERRGVIGSGRGAPARARKALAAAIDSAMATRQVKHLNFRPKGPGTVAKPELGTKRLCANCGAKFYDLSKDPIICPKCQTVMELAPVVAPRVRPDAPAVAPAAAEEEVVAPETAEAEFVSLEEAGMDDAPFIEEQEEGDEDVTDIIGDRDDEEET